jgi:nucleotide-binding universal stress UspA family protein
MKQILVGVDGSKESRAALATAVDLAAARKSLVRLACVVAPFDAFSPDAIAFPEQLEAHREAARAIVDELAQQFGKQGVPIETQVIDGLAAEKLATLAQQPEVELVVVGHRGRSAVSRILIGSVADRLVQICPKPVLVVR